MDDVAAHLGVTKDSIYRWIERRGLPASKIGKLWKLKLTAVDAWVEARGADDTQGATTVARPPTRASRKPERLVFVVDDDRLVRESVSDFLEDNGYGVVLAADGGQALELLATSDRRPDLIVLDLAMPNVDGPTFREQQARIPDLASIPVIVVTGLAEPKFESAAFLRKPLKLPALLATIEKVIASTGAPAKEFAR